jgi:hypothetical protein
MKERMRLAGHVARMGDERKVYKILVGKPMRKRLLRRPSIRWENGLRIELRKFGDGCMEWIQLAQDWDRWWAVVNKVITLPVLCHGVSFGMKEIMFLLLRTDSRNEAVKTKPCNGGCGTPKI